MTDHIYKLHHYLCPISAWCPKVNIFLQPHWKNGETEEEVFCELENIHAKPSSNILIPSTRKEDSNSTIIQNIVYFHKLLIYCDIANMLEIPIIKCNKHSPWYQNDPWLNSAIWRQDTPATGSPAYGRLRTSQLTAKSKANRYNAKILKKNNSGDFF